MDQQRMSEQALSATLTTRPLLPAAIPILLRFGRMFAAAHFPAQVAALPAGVKRADTPFPWKTREDIQARRIEPVWGANLTLENLPKLLDLYNSDRTNEERRAFRIFFAIALLNGFQTTHPKASRPLIERLRDLYLTNETDPSEGVSNYVKGIISGAAKDALSYQVFNDYVDLIQYVSPIVTAAQYFGYSHEDRYRFDFSNTFIDPTFLFGQQSWGLPGDERAALGEHIIREHGLAIPIVQRIGPFWTAFRTGDLRKAALEILSLRYASTHYFEILKRQVETLAKSGDPRARDIVQNVLPAPTVWLPEVFEGPLETVRLDSIVNSLPNLEGPVTTVVPIDLNEVRDAHIIEAFDRLRQEDPLTPAARRSLTVLSSDRMSSQIMTFGELAGRIRRHEIDYDGKVWSLRTAPAAAPAAGNGSGFAVADTDYHDFLGQLFGAVLLAIENNVEDLSGFLKRKDLGGAIFNLRDIGSWAAMQAFFAIQDGGLENAYRLAYLIACELVPAQETSKYFIAPVIGRWDDWKRGAEHQGLDPHRAAEMFVDALIAEIVKRHKTLFAPGSTSPLEGLEKEMARAKLEIQFRDWAEPLKVLLADDYAKPLPRETFYRRLHRIGSGMTHEHAALNERLFRLFRQGRAIWDPFAMVQGDAPTASNLVGSLMTPGPTRTGVHLTRRQMLALSGAAVMAAAAGLVVAPSALSAFPLEGQESEPTLRDRFDQYLRDWFRSAEESTNPAERELAPWLHEIAHHFEIRKPGENARDNVEIYREPDGAYQIVNGKIRFTLFLHPDYVRDWLDALTTTSGEDRRLVEIAFRSEIVKEIGGLQEAQDHPEVGRAEYILWKWLDPILQYGKVWEPTALIGTPLAEAVKIYTAIICRLETIGSLKEHQSLYAHHLTAAQADRIRHQRAWSPPAYRNLSCIAGY